MDQKLSPERKVELLQSFMEEFFPFDEFLEMGFFLKEMKEDYEAQSNRVCEYFGYKTVYEYGAQEPNAIFKNETKSIDQ